MRLLYILGRNDSLHCYNGVQAQDSFCEYTSNRKITTLVPSLCFSFFPFVPIWILIYSSIIFYFFIFCFHSGLSAGCSHQQMIATFTPEDHLIRRQGKKKMQAVNELPSFPSVKGVYKLDPFVRALLCSLSLLLPPCLLLPPLSLLILAPSPPSRPSSCSSIFSLYLPASRSSSSVAGAALSGFGSEQHLLSARFMFRISHLMRTKEINWWFKPNETSVKLTGLINWNK